MKKVFLTVVALMLPLAANAAEFKAFPDKNKPYAYNITLKGDIVDGDLDRLIVPFNGILNANPENYIRALILESDGGNVGEALEIGIAIHKRKVGTYVRGNSTCASSCALLWLAGTTRWIASNAHIGFHSSYNAETGKPGNGANAVIGAYLRDMGLSNAAIYYLLNTEPNKMEWLSREKAEKYGIDAITVREHQ